MIDEKSRMMASQKKELKDRQDVIPAKAGIQKYQMVTKHWTPAPVPDPIRDSPG
jgi:hypothetical protein